MNQKRPIILFFSNIILKKLDEIEVIKIQKFGTNTKSIDQRYTTQHLAEQHLQLL